MIKISKKVPMGLAALCVVSLFGLKDTGVFLNAHVQTTYSGNKIAFQKGEEVQVLEKTDNGYIVAKDNAKVTIPTEKIALKNTSDVYKVTKATPIKNSNGVIRNLFIGEELALIEDKGDVVVVKGKDGIVGEVSKANLELVATSAKKEVKKDEKKNEKVAPAKAEQNAKISVGKAIAVNNENGSDLANKAVESALSKLGSKYIYGATGNGGFDCSGLIYCVYKNELGINVPRTSIEQSNYGKTVDKSDLKKGDLVFFNTLGGGVSHVGIYMGNGEFIHASTGQRQVRISNLSEKYYESRFVKATRVL